MRILTSVAEMLPLATIRLTPDMTSRNPHAMRIVMGSPNIITPRKTAVRGSIAPRMAVGVLPINVMACVVQ